MNKNQTMPQARNSLQILRIEACISAKDQAEQKFLRDVNVNPDLSIEILHLRPNIDSHGRINRNSNGELEGAGGQFDPGLRRNAGFHFDRERRLCSLKTG